MKDLLMIVQLSKKKMRKKIYSVISLSLSMILFSSLAVPGAGMQVYAADEDPMAAYTQVAYYREEEQTLDNGQLWNLEGQVFENAVYDMEVSLDSRGNDDWIGFLFNREAEDHKWNDSGCMVYLRGNNNPGALEVLGMELQEGTQIAPTIPSYAPGEKVHLRIWQEEGTIRIYAGKTADALTEMMTATTERKKGYAGFFISSTSGETTGTVEKLTVRVTPKEYENQVEAYFEQLESHKILRDDVKVRFPELPEGHNMTINSSSDPSVIEIDGTVHPQAEETKVTLNITVSCVNPSVSDSKDLTYTVPRKTTDQDTEFMQNLEYGIFLHYVWGGDDVVNSIDENGNVPENIHDFVNDFDVDQIVEDCKSFGVQYVIFTVWHYKMNPLYHSEVYREWRDNANANNPSETDRDIIMDLADQLGEAGIDLFLYTHPNDLHDFSEADKATFDYKYRGDTDFDYDKYNDYLEAQYREVTERYKGKIKGYFIDEGLGQPTNASFVDYDRLRAVIKDVDPSLAMIQNFSEVPGVGYYNCDTGMVEDRIQTSWGSGDWGDSLKTSITDGDSWPSFGLPFAARIGERPFNWSAFYDKDGNFTGNDTDEFKNKEITLASAEDIYRYTVYQAASNVDGMGSCWAFGPYAGADNASMWEPGVGETMKNVGTLLEGREVSVFGTKPSSSWPAKIDVDASNPRVKTGCLGDVTYVAMSNQEETYEYIHVLNPENEAVSGKTLSLPFPADGKSFSSATLMDGTALELSQGAGGVTVTLPEDQSWDEIDTVIRLEVGEDNLLTQYFEQYNYTVFEDDFSNAEETAGKWSNASIENEQMNVVLGKHYNIKDAKYEGAIYEMELSVNDGADWTGFLFNRTNQTDIWDNSGCLVYLRGNGVLEVLGMQANYIMTDKKVPGYQEGQLVNIKVIAVDGNIWVYANDTLMVTATTTWTSGYAGFWCSGNIGSGRLDNVIVKTLPPTADTKEEIQNVFTELKEKLKASKVYIDSDTISDLPKISKEGYSYKIKKSTNESVIQLDGTVVPPEKKKRVNVTFELKYEFDGKTVETDTCKVTYEVKAKTTADDIAHFLNDKYGLFVHYVWAGQRRIGSGGQPQQISARYPDGTSAKTIDEMIENFDAEQFAQDCEEMGMQYVIFTAWHYGTNPVYPSKVYEEWRTHEKGDLPTDDGEHDLIEKVYNALEKKGINLYLYTHPYDIHDLYQEDKEQFDYKYTGDLTFDYDKWNDYLNAQYKELCERYKGKIKGMFLDEGLANPANNLSVDYPRLRDTVKSVDPSLVMMQNEYNGKYSCDTSMWELPTAWHGGSYNNLASWQTNTIPIGTSIGNIYQGYSWWAVKNRGDGTSGLESAENAYLYTVLQLGTNTEGGGMAWAAGPYCGINEEGSDQYGIWEDGVKETLVKMYEYMKPVEEAMKNTRPSKSYVTPAKSTINSVGWGVATESEDGVYTYLHVVNHPEGNTLQIAAPADGKVFQNAELLATGEKVGMTQTTNGIILTLPEGREWDKLNTVIKLTLHENAELYAAIAKAKAVLEEGTPWFYDLDLEVVLQEAVQMGEVYLEKENVSKKKLAAVVKELQETLAAYLETYQGEIQVGENLAAGKTVKTSSSLEGSNFSAAYLTDGNKFGESNRGWTSDPHSTTPNQVEYAEIDLGSSQMIGRVDLTPLTVEGYGFPEDFKIEISADGEMYQEVYSQMGYQSDGSVLQINFPAKDARYVKITGTKLRVDQKDGNSYRMQFSEVEVFPMSVEEAAYRVDSVIQPSKGDETIIFPEAPKGFTVTGIAESSNERVISMDGTIQPGKKTETVRLRFTVLRESDQATAETKTFTMIVPGNKAKNKQK